MPEDKLRRYPHGSNGRYDGDDKDDFAGIDAAAEQAEFLDSELHAQLAEAAVQQDD